MDSLVYVIEALAYSAALSWVITRDRRDIATGTAVLLLTSTIAYALAAYIDSNGGSALKLISSYERDWLNLLNAIALVALTRGIALSALNILGLFAYNVNVALIFTSGIVSALSGGFYDPASQLTYTSLYYSQLVYTSYHLLGAILAIALRLPNIPLVLAPLTAFRRIRGPVLATIIFLEAVALVYVYVSHQGVGMDNSRPMFRYIDALNRSLSLLGNGTINVVLVNSPYGLVLGRFCGEDFTSYGYSMLIAVSDGTCSVEVSSLYVDWVRVRLTMNYSVNTTYMGKVYEVSVMPQVNYLTYNGSMALLWQWVTQPTNWRVVNRGYVANVLFSQVEDNSSVLLWALSAGVMVNVVNGTCSVNVSEGDYYPWLNDSVLMTFNGFEEDALRYYASLYMKPPEGSIINYLPINPKPPNDLHQYLANITCMGNGSETALVNVTIVGLDSSGWVNEKTIAYTPRLKNFLDSVFGLVKAYALSLTNLPNTMSWLLYSLSIPGAASALLVIIGEEAMVSTPILRFIEDLRNLIFAAPSRAHTIARLVRYVRRGRRRISLGNAISNEGIVERGPNPIARALWIRRLGKRGLLGLSASSRGNPYLTGLVRLISGTGARPSGALSIRLRHLLARPLGDVETGYRVILGRGMERLKEEREFLVSRLIRNEQISLSLYDRGIISRDEAQRRVRYWFYRTMLEYRARLRRLARGIDTKALLEFITHGHSRRLIVNIAKGYIKSTQKSIERATEDPLTIAVLLLMAMYLDAKSLEVLVKTGIVNVDKERLMALMGSYRLLTSIYSINNLSRILRYIEDVYGGSLPRDVKEELSKAVKTLTRFRRKLIKGSTSIRVGFVQGTTPIGKVTLLVTPRVHYPRLARMFVRDSSNVSFILRRVLKDLGRLNNSLAIILRNYLMEPRNIGILEISALMNLHPLTLIKEILRFLDEGIARQVVNTVLSMEILDNAMRSEIRQALVGDDASRRYSALVRGFLTRMLRLSMGHGTAGDRLWLMTMTHYMDTMVSEFLRRYLLRLGVVNLPKGLSLTRQETLRGIFSGVQGFGEYSSYSTLISLIRLRKSISRIRARFLRDH